MKISGHFYTPGGFQEGNAEEFEIVCLKLQIAKLEKERNGWFTVTVILLFVVSALLTALSWLNP